MRVNRPKLFLLLMAVALLTPGLPSSCLADPSPPNSPPGLQIDPGWKYMPDRILVRPKKGVTMNQMAALHSANGASLMRAFHRFGNLQVVRVPNGANVEEWVAKYKKHPLVANAEPDLILHALIDPPNDPEWYQQWGPEQIRALDGWGIRTDASNIIVAVIDTGVDYTHPDLQANMWVNTGEIPGNLIDDDSDGYIDDVYGMNALWPTSYPEAGDPMDDGSHGTHCAGIVGAVGNNSVGIAGVAWGVKIMALKWMDGGGYGYESGAIACIEYAADHGAHITSNSWGIGGPELYNAIAELRDPNDDGDLIDGIPFVAAAGNEGMNNDWWNVVPASFDLDNIVSVANTMSNDELNPGSSFGRYTVDLGAPGTGIYSCVPGSSYDYKTGTSMSAPHVAGALALVKAEYPGEYYAKLFGRIYAGVDQGPTLAYTTLTEGRLNLYGALTCTPPPMMVLPNIGGEFTGSEGGAFISAYNFLGQVEVARDPEYHIANTTSSPLTWSATTSDNWLTLSSSGGTLAAGDSVVVVASVNSNANSKAWGDYVNTVTFTGPSGNTTRDIILHVRRMHVSPEGSDDSDGFTWATAKQTVSAALSAASQSYVRDIWVEIGDYTGESWYTGVTNMRLYGGFRGDETLLSQRPPFPRGNLNQPGVPREPCAGFGGITIPPGSGCNSVLHGGVVLPESSDTSSTVDGFTIRDANMCGLACNSYRGTIRNNTIIANSNLDSYYYAGGGGIWVGGGTAKILNNLIAGNRAAYGPGGGIYLNGPWDGTVVANNIIAGNSSYSDGGGISVSGGVALVANNTIVGNTSDGEGAVSLAYTTATFANNIVAFNDSGVLRDLQYGGDPIVTSNDVYGNPAFAFKDKAETPWTPPGNIELDPKLSCVEYANWHIKLDSPCRNGGNNGYILTGWLDMDGQARTYEGTVDIGADESDDTQPPLGPYRLIKVSTTGNDSNSGTSWYQAKRTIQAGIDTAAQYGGQVWVKAGTYAEQVTLRGYVQVLGGFRGDEISWIQRNWNRNVAVIDGEMARTGVTAEVGCPFGKLSGFVIRHGGMVDGSTNGGGIHLQYCWPTISNNYIMANFGYLGGGIYCEGSTANIINNKIASNHAYDGSGLYCSSSGDLIANNTILDNECGNEGGGIYCAGWSSLPSIVNNIIMHNTSGIYTSDDLPSVRYCDVWENTGYSYKYQYGPWDPGMGDGNISADPAFYRPYYGNVRIKFLSPCRNAGDSSILGTGWQDIDGQYRSAPLDIGADEYPSAVEYNTPLIVRVATNGNDANDGSSWSVPKASVPNAIDTACAQGGEVWVKGGTYNQRVKLMPYAFVYGGFGGTETDKYERNWKSYVTTLDGQAGGSVVTAFCCLTSNAIDGFTIRNGTGTSDGYYSLYGGGVYSLYSAGSIANNRITANTATHGCGIYCSHASPCIAVNEITANNDLSAYGGGIYCDESSPRIEANTISANYVYQGAGIYCYMDCSPSIVNNVVTGNQTYAPGAGILLPYGGEPEVVNNTIVGNNSHGWEGSGIYVSNADGGVISNNIISSNIGGTGVYSYGDPTFTGNDLYQNLPSDTNFTPDSSNIFLNPKLINAAGGDYQLLGDSPCIDAGVSVDDPVQDKDWKPRPFDGNLAGGAQYDIGAYEYQANLAIAVPNYPNGTLVAFGPVMVTATFQQVSGPNWVYVERTDKASGIRIHTTRSLGDFPIGKLVHVKGTIQTDADRGERYILADSGWPQPTASSDTPRPLGMCNLWLGGGGIGYTPPLRYGYGFYNIGLLVQSWGKVKAINNGSGDNRYFYIDDGSRYVDGSGTDGVRVIVPASVTEWPVVGSYVKVSGVSCAYKSIASPVTYSRVLRPRDRADILMDYELTWESDAVDGLVPGKENAIGLPGVPRNPAPGSVVVGCSGDPGIPLAGYLARWDALTQTRIPFPDCDGLFGNCLIGDGYSLWLVSDNTRYCYERTALDDDQMISLPRGSLPYGFYTMAGNPFESSKAWASCKVSNGVETKPFCDAVAAGWIYGVRECAEGAWPWIDPATDSLQMGQAYRVYSKVNSLALIVPASP